MSPSDTAATIVLSGSAGPVSRDVGRYLTDRGHTILDDKAIETGTTITGIIFDPGLLDGGADGSESAAKTFERTVRALLRQCATRSDGGARVVVLGTRDALGAADHTGDAGEGGALVSVMRSLALELGRRGVTVNLVAGLPQQPAAGPGTLLPWAGDIEDIAATVEFFLDPRSDYVTGQVMYCCGGAQLLSSHSV